MKDNNYKLNFFVHRVARAVHAGLLPVVYDYEHLDWEL